MMPQCDGVSVSGLSVNKRTRMSYISVHSSVNMSRDTEGVHYTVYSISIQYTVYSTFTVSLTCSAMPIPVDIFVSATPGVGIRGTGHDEATRLPHACRWGKGDRVQL